MSQGLTIIVSIVVALTFVLAIGRKFKISSRYERKPRTLNSWSALDKGIDPTEEIQS